MGCSCLKSHLVVKSNIIPIKNDESHLLSSHNQNNDNIPLIPANTHINNPSLSQINNVQLNSNNNLANYNSNANYNNSHINTNNNNLHNLSNHNQNIHYDDLIRIHNFEPYLISKNDPNFNFPTIENEYLGIGLKRLPGYISNITLEELEKKREEFWTSRIEGNREVWELLRAICSDKDLDDNDIIGMLKAGGIVLYHECIDIAFDFQGTIYEIPNYCINDPSQYDIPEIEYSKEIPEKRDIEIFVRHVIEQCPIKITNLNTIKDLKEELIKKYKNLTEGTTEKHIRFFFGGRELQDEKGLWFYNIDNKNIIQLLLRPIKDDN